ncbi:MAG TPA: branched-chain amino acid ABC transporter permease [Ktedonobacteraceae bacterium]|jgi:branched-chain amino acid transport system permease protein|nr:branched-chain amino acid ABC transporter permease [Ktedonobacteraceae bacterium]
MSARGGVWQRSFAVSRKTWLLVGSGCIVLLLLIWAGSGTAWGRASYPVLLQALITGLLLGGVYSLVSMGLTLIFGVLDIINFAHGALMALAMYAAYLLVTFAAFNPYLSLLITVPLLFLLGFVLQRFVINRIMGQPAENQLLLTFGLALLVENALLLIFTGTPKALPAPFAQSSLHLLGAVVDIPRLIAFAGSLLLAGVLYFLLSRTTIGTAVRAVAENAQGAAMVGIDVRTIYALAFGLGTACVGAAGALVAPFLSLDPTVGEQFTIIAFVVVVLGGMGNVAGAFLGGLIIGLLQEIGGAFFPNINKLLIVFLVFVLLLLLRPQGLLGRKA